MLVSVSADDEKETLEKFLEKEPMPWVHWWDSGTENPVLKKFRVRAFPTLYLIDHTGIDPAQVGRQARQRQARQGGRGAGEGGGEGEGVSVVPAKSEPRQSEWRPAFRHGCFPPVYFPHGHGRATVVRLRSRCRRRRAAPLAVELVPAPDPWDVARRLAHLPHLLFLDSAEKHAERGRYSYVAAQARRSWGTDPQSRHFAAHRSRTPHRMTERHSTARPIDGLPPFQGGLAGLFGYGLNRVLESRVPRVPLRRVPVSRSLRWAFTTG